MIRASVGGLTTARSQFIELTRDAQRRTARAELQTLGRQWEEEVTRIWQANFPRRDGVRHKANTTHLENSAQARVTEGGNNGFPMTLDLTIKPGVSGAKVAAIEHGQKAHRITAVNAPVLRHGDAPGDIYKPNQKSVMWKPGPKSTPGQTIRPMETARNTVLARRRR